MFLKYNEGYETKFLLIIENEYVRKRNIINKSNVLTRDILTFRCLKSQINDGCRNAPDVVKVKPNKFIDPTLYLSTLRVKFSSHQYESMISAPSYNAYEPMTIKLFEKSIMISSFHKIDYKAFSNLTNLKEIDYSNNVRDLNELDHKSLNGLINLKKVSFSNSKISKIQFDLFKGLDSLEEINFINNQIVEIILLRQILL